MRNDGDLLIVESTGFDESLEEVQQYGLAILSACKQGNHTKVLCNEINLEYRLGTFDTFLAAEFPNALTAV